MQNITIAGTSYPCRVTMGAMVRFKRIAGRDVSKLTTDDVADWILFIWCCILSACSADGVSAPDMDFDKFADLMAPDTIEAFFSGVQEESAGQKKTTE